ncbi:MAG: DUF4340 domain-containing protein [Candidatus Cloacimonetes bacterium]|nr:DUF4340 domain-containing protein [Candidatus Cloacimonadota bacterium]
MSKKQIIYITILIALVIVFLITKINNNVEKRINFFQADSAKIRTIEISNIKDTLRFSKKNDEWILIYPFENPINTFQMKKIFTEVLPVKTSNLPISESESSFDTYKVTNSQGTCIRFFDENDNVLDEAIIGKSSSSKTTPARRPNENKIYKLEDNINYIITAESDNWREKTILEIEKNNISKISVICDINAYEIAPSDSFWYYTDGKSSLGVDINNKTLQDIISSISKLTVNGFVDNNYEDYKEKLSSPNLEIGIELFDGSSHYIRIALDKDSKYVLQFDTEESHMYLVYNNWVEKFIKEAIDFK